MTVLTIRRRLERDAELSYTLVRIAAGVLFWFHGAQKFGIFGGMGGGAAAPLTLLWFGGVIEFIGGAALAAGLLARWVALVAAVEMAAAYLMAHAPRGPWPLTNGGELALLYLVIWLLVAARGAGRHSLDRILGFD